MNIGFYCLSYKNKRRDAIENIFNTLQINAQFSTGVDFNDRRLNEIDDKLKRVWSTCYGHLDMIRSFYESDKDYGIFCEDDIIIRKDFMIELPHILCDFNTLELDILLLGYMCESEIDTYSSYPTWLKRDPFKYLHYPDDGTWGAQMYLLSRKHALCILSQYYYGYAEWSLVNSSIVPFSADWIITKTGKRALIYPPVAIEEFELVYDDKGQTRSHTACYRFCYKPELF